MARLKAWIRESWLYKPLSRWVDSARLYRQYATWKREGSPVPPPHAVKQFILREYARKYGLRVLVETGTSRGEMVAAMKDFFDTLYSIELSEELHEKAKKRFRHEDNVHLIQGDSGVELKNVIELLDRPALFWLDGHYSGGKTARGAQDTPVYMELEHILAADEERHVVLIDDARSFGTDPAYPSIDEVKEYIRARSFGRQIQVTGDSIRITPR